jgi:hypothetical protein
MARPDTGEYSECVIPTPSAGRMRREGAVWGLACLGRQRWETNQMVAMLGANLHADSITEQSDQIRNGRAPGYLPGL